MKKRITLLLAMSCLLGLTACGEKTLKQPPELRIVADDGSVTASKGTYSWGYDNGFNWIHVEADSCHPLDCKDFVEALTTDDGEVRLKFDVEPYAVDAVECWSDEYWGNPDAQCETVGLHVVNDTVNVPLKPGGWVYMVKASWEQENYNGSCYYVFHVAYNDRGA